MSQLDNLKKKIQQTVKAAKGQKTATFSWSRTAFKKDLSTDKGFGVQDLKPTYLKLYTWLLQKYGTNLTVLPGNTSKESFSITFTVKL